MSAELTDNQRALLERASGREDRCFVLPPNLKGGAAQKVAAKLIAEGLAKEVKAKEGAPIWRSDGESQQAYSLKLTAAGAKAVARVDEQRGKSAPEPQAQESSAVATGPSEAPHHASERGWAAPRVGSKLASVMALLRRPEGATIDDLTEATGWLPHTTRAAITGVRKRGYSVILERKSEGASAYRISDTSERDEAAAVSEVGENKAPRRRREVKANAAS